MKKIIFSLLLTLGLLPVASNALNLTYSLPAGSTSMSNLVLLSAATISQITIANPTATATTIAFVDNSVTNLTLATAAYTTTVYNQQAITNIYTNYFGVVNSNYFPTALVAASSTVAAATNLVNFPLVVQAPTNTTIVLDGTYRFFKGLVLTNGGAAVTVSLTYQQ